jgi:hypothetical protein
MPDISFGDLLRSDPFARFVAGFFIVVVALATCIWACFLAAAVTNALVAPDLLPAVNGIIDNFLPLIGGLGGDYVSALVGVVPIAFAAVCYATVRARRRLNVWGRSTVLLSLLGVLAAFFALTVLKAFPEKMHIFGTASVILTLSDTSEIALRTSLFYVAVLLGLRPAHENQ